MSARWTTVEDHSAWNGSFPWLSHEVQIAPHASEVVMTVLDHTHQLSLRHQEPRSSPQLMAGRSVQAQNTTPFWRGPAAWPNDSRSGCTKVERFNPTKLGSTQHLSFGHRLSRTQAQRWDLYTPLTEAFIAAPQAHRQPVHGGDAWYSFQLVARALRGRA